MVNAHTTNGVIKSGLFVAMSVPSPPIEATKIVRSGVEQKAKISKIKLINNFKKLNWSMFNTTNPPQIVAIIEKSETISRLVSLFVNPLMISASKTFIHAYIKTTPSKTLTQDKTGEKPDITSKTMFAV